MAKRIIFLSAILALLFVLSVVCFRAKPPPVQSFRMTNGLEITLMAVTHDTNTPIVLGRPFQRSLYRLLPSKLKTWSGAKVFYCNIYSTPQQTNIPTFWLLEKPSNPSAPPGSAAYLAVRVRDEFGLEYDPNGYSMGTMSAGPDGELSYYQIEAPDPHGKIVGLSVYDSNEKTNRLVTFTIPGLSNVPLPATQSFAGTSQPDGDLEVQMLSLVTGLKSGPYAYSGMTNGVLFSRAAFRVTKQGAPAPAWLPRGVRVTDVQGKRVAVRMSNPAFEGPNQVLNFEGNLDPTNGPFKLKVEFTHYTGFSSNELVVFKNVPFPADAEPIGPKMEMDLQGRKLILENVYAANSRKPVDYFQPNQTVIQAQLVSYTYGDQVQLIDAIDESGKGMPPGGMGSSKGEYYFSFQPSVKAKSMTLTFAVHQSRFVEFEAMPTVAATNLLSAGKY